MSIAHLLAVLRRGKRRNQPRVEIWLCVFTPSGRNAVVIWQ